MNDQQLAISVLYVEDEELSREEIQQFLKWRVGVVRVAEDGRDGLEIFKAARPDLVITDILMPRMNGLEMAREIKGLDPEAKIIVTSAHSDAPYLLEAISTGVDAYVMKPVDTARLDGAIRKCAEVISYRRTIKSQHEYLNRSLEELKDALAKVKMLSGFLPICASCKKIRDDKGFWRQIEVYIQEHSEAEFTHGICPDCTRKLYPEFYDQHYGGKDQK